MLRTNRKFSYLILGAAFPRKEPVVDMTKSPPWLLFPRDLAWSIFRFILPRYTESIIVFVTKIMSFSLSFPFFPGPRSRSSHSSACDLDLPEVTIGISYSLLPSPRRAIEVRRGSYASFRCIHRLLIAPLPAPLFSKRNYAPRPIFYARSGCADLQHLRSFVSS